MNDVISKVMRTNRCALSISISGGGLVPPILVRYRYLHPLSLLQASDRRSRACVCSGCCPAFALSLLPKWMPSLHLLSARSSFVVFGFRAIAANAPPLTSHLRHLSRSFSLPIFNISLSISVALTPYSCRLHHRNYQVARARKKQRDGGQLIAQHFDNPPDAATLMCRGSVVRITGKISNRTSDCSTTP